MFTGIVQAKGRIAGIDRNEFGARLRVDGRGWPDPAVYMPAHGDSICVSGVCLTVVQTAEEAGGAGGTLGFDVIAETLAKSSLGDLKPGDAVNLEPPVTASQPLGGHFMQGHVDGVGEVTDIKADGDEHRVTVKPPAELMAYIIPKGSIAIDGISLTLAEVYDDRFEVALIPTTLDLTTLGDTEVGKRVNLEADIISKTVVHQLERLRGGKSGKADAGLTMQLLRDAGFMADTGCSNVSSMIKPPPELDGARVLWWAHAGAHPFGEVSGATDDERWIYAFTVCQYAPSKSDPSGTIYRFSCNRNWEVVQDSDYESVEEAKAGIPLQYDRSRVVWHRYEG